MRVFNALCNSGALFTIVHTLNSINIPLIYVMHNAMHFTDGNLRDGVKVFPRCCFISGEFEWTGIVVGISTGALMV